MRKFTLPCLLSYVGHFLPALNARSSLVLAVAMALGAGTGARGSEPPPTVTGSRIGNVVTVTFQPTAGSTSGDYNEYAPLFGGQYVDLTSINTFFFGQLVSITANLRLESYGFDFAGGTRPVEPDPSDPNHDPDYLTEVTDLAVYIGGLTSGNPPSFSNGVLQLGGDTQGIPGTTNYLYWYSSFPNSYNYDGTSLNGIFSDVSNLGISLTPSTPKVWLVNTYSSSVQTASFGRWSGSIDFTFASPGGSGVPDASRTALLLAPGTLLLLGLAGRSRRRG
jgi:hypothetical protein